MSPAIKTFLAFLFVGSFSYGQNGQYTYKRELKGISGQWHKVVLPDEIYGKTEHNLADIRIIGFTANNDTIEAPYLLRSTAEKTDEKEVTFKTLNTSHNEKGYYFTFEIPASEPVNQIELKFQQQNFDWQLTLEGSQNQHEWFTITENYRILSIKNDLTDFQFTKLLFPESNYRFFRVLVKSKEKPELTAVRTILRETTNGSLKNYPVRRMSKTENKQARQTEIEVELPVPVPVNFVKIDVSETVDYYRPVTIKYLADSFKTENGWQYIYSNLTYGTLHSAGDNSFGISTPVTTGKLKILIHNQDNQPLSVGTVTVKGYMNELVVRLTEDASYYLIYGNTNAVAPKYDLAHFPDKIPESLTPLQLGNEYLIEKQEAQATTPLFSNQNWLWAVMALIILTLGWFSVKMIRKK